MLFILTALLIIMMPPGFALVTKTLSLMVEMVE